MPDKESKELEQKGEDLSDKEAIRQLKLISSQIRTGCFFNRYNDEELRLEEENAGKTIYHAAAELEKQLTATQQALEQLKEDNASLEESLSALTNKLGDNCCACSYDKIEDVCMAHTPKLKKVQQALDTAVEGLAVAERVAMFFSQYSHGKINDADMEWANKEAKKYLDKVALTSISKK